MKLPSLTGRDRDRWLWAGIGTVGALAASGALQAAHMRRITRDPENGVLEQIPRGRTQSVPSADGTALHVELFGPEDGDTVVLAHGWTEALIYWTYVIRGLEEKGLRVVAYDLRGHGDSAPAKTDYAIPRFGQDLEAVLAACVPKGRRAVVAGHSLGAMSIASWADEHDVERRVRAAALLNTGVGDLIAEHLLLPLPGIAQAVNQLIARRGFMGSRAPLPRYSTPLSYGAIRYMAFGPDATPAQVAFFERMLITCPPHVRADIGIAMSDMDLHDALPRLTVPTIVIAGADDRLTPPSHARRIAEMLPQLRRLTVLENAGHMTPLERPDVVIDALAELATLTAERVPA
ncbi:MAG TPA: alpha/beta hydrolase [Solirubrobacteraceae bacterium]|nr:alpha/beta hydrolase [Solirubrobacteraceae bacterium]